jgi:hypothetical protein
MWERLHVLITRTQMSWLRAESYTRGKSIGEVVRDLVSSAMSRQSRDGESGNCTPPSKTDMK